MCAGSLHPCSLKQHIWRQYWRYLKLDKQYTELTNIIIWWDLPYALLLLDAVALLAIVDCFVLTCLCLSSQDVLCANAQTTVT